MCVFEAAMASNLMLTYGGVTPVRGLFGFQPRDFYDIDNPGIMAHGGALETTPDFIAMRPRDDEPNAQVQRRLTDPAVLDGTPLARRHTLPLGCYEKFHAS